MRDLSRAAGENRTLMVLLPLDFESSASTNSATTALEFVNIIQNRVFSVNLGYGNCRYLNRYICIY